MMKLLRFRVKSFRSFVDSGWIDCQNVTVFAGENESGKSSLFMALLKLMDPHTLKDADKTIKALSKINVKKDLPAHMFDENPEAAINTAFIEAEFEVADESLDLYLSGLNRNFPPLKRFIISKTFGGKYSLDFINEFAPVHHPHILRAILDRIPRFAYYKEVTEIDSKVDFLSLALKLNGNTPDKKLTAKEQTISNLLSCLDIWESNLINSIVQIYNNLSLDNKNEVDFREIFEKIPLFKERVERGFAALNTEFLNWWGRNDIFIAFEPYSRGVQIKIIDTNGHSFLLEDRSTGFRRFFALFLSFSTVGKDKKSNNSILLFDEAGAALHPLAQKKLENFFNGLGGQIQLMYNTHTSYMLSVENINRVRVVYKNDANCSFVSNSLKINEDRSNEWSLFPIQSAFALHIAEKQLMGFSPIVVLNDRDESYLTLIKYILIEKGDFNTIFSPLVFAAGVNGIDGAAEVLGAGELPLILLPSDFEGNKVKERLLSNKYAHCPEKILELGNFTDAYHFEDLIPAGMIKNFCKTIFDKFLGADFSYNEEKRFVPQIKDYIESNNIRLPDNFRSEIAKIIKFNTMINYESLYIPPNYLEIWKNIWRNLYR